MLAAEGAHVVVNDFGGDTNGHGSSSTSAAEVVAEIIAAGGSAVADSNNVATGGAAIIATAIEAFGGLHLVVNNAGIANGGEIDEIPKEEFDRMLDVHLGGTVGICRAAWPILREQHYGRIVNTSSASFFGLPGTSAYITAKAAIMGLSRALSHDGRKHGIVVNAIMPSAYSRLTARSPEFAPVMKAAFPAEDIAPFVGALLADEVPCTGETFVVGGGWAARVVLATAQGAGGLKTIDECLAQFDQVMALDDMTVPADAMAEVIQECRRLGVPGMS